MRTCEPAACAEVQRTLPGIALFPALKVLCHYDARVPNGGRKAHSLEARLSHSELLHAVDGVHVGALEADSAQGCESQLSVHAPDCTAALHMHGVLCVRLNAQLHLPPLVQHSQNPTCLAGARASTPRPAGRPWCRWHPRAPALCAGVNTARVYDTRCNIPDKRTVYAV